MMMSAELKGSATWFILFCIFFRYNIIVLSFIILGYMWQILERNVGSFLNPSPPPLPPPDLSSTSSPQKSILKTGLRWFMQWKHENSFLMYNLFPQLLIIASYVIIVTMCLKSLPKNIVTIIPWDNYLT